MINGDVHEFLDRTTYEECAVLYKGVKYFFHGVIYHPDTNTYSYDIVIWNDKREYVRTVFGKTADTPDKCMSLAQSEPIFDGKTFWEAEPEMEWVEW